MQEWLKNKKNLPIVVALMAFVLLGAGGIIALELGLFTPQPAATPVAQSIPSGPPSSPGGVPAVPSTTPASRPPAGRPPLSGSRPGLPTGLPGSRSPAAAAANAPVTPKSDIVNPLLGPDPFKIPGGTQKLAKVRLSQVGPKPQLRNVIGPLDLFRIHPATPATPPIFGQPQGGASVNPAANYRLSGLINGPDGNNAILEVGGQSQSVKPGDTLADGTSVQSIQSTSVTLKSAGGSVFILPISAGTPDQGTTPFNGQGATPFNNQGQPPYPGGFNNQPQAY